LKSLDSRDLVSLRQDAIHDLARQASDNAKRMTGEEISGGKREGRGGEEDEPRFNSMRFNNATGT
jgi:hypothetical protein